MSRQYTGVFRDCKLNQLIGTHYFIHIYILDLPTGNGHGGLLVLSVVYKVSPGTMPPW